MRRAGRMCALVVAAAAAGGAAGAGGAAAGAAAGAVQPAAAAHFAEALAPRPFVFPRDHGPHPQFRQEWWYLTGNLDADGARFGFELTFFRFALAPEGSAVVTTATGPTSAWRTRQIYLAHFAITDVARGRFRSAQKLERDALGLAGAQGEPLRVWIDNWSLSAVASVPTGPAPTGLWRVNAAQPGYGLELELTPLVPPTLNGDAGLSVKAAVPGDATYYYSIPRLAATGRIVRDGRAIAVKGLAWFDREWGSGGLGPNEVGWDWFGLQLGDGSALMFYVLRDRGGGRDPHSAGTWVDASGTAHPLSSRDIEIAVTGHWTDGEGVRYPAGWRIAVPSLSLAATLQPALADQELRTQPRYWEGAVDVKGERSGRPLTGRGYVELVGYNAER